MSIREMQLEVAEWADGVFPDRTSENAMVKLVMEEIPELLRDPTDALEYADLVILILDIAWLNGIDIEEAFRRKMTINRDRTWRIDQKTGLMHHIRGIT